MDEALRKQAEDSVKNRALIIGSLEAETGCAHSGCCG